MQNGKRINFAAVWRVQFEVSDGNMRYVLDLESRSCDYGFWKISGSRCSHALHYEKMMKPMDFVHKSMAIKMYMNLYSHFTKALLDEI